MTNPVTNPERETALKRWAWADVDLAAIRRNVETIRHLVAPAAVWAVVKANAYGHGAVPVAQAALDAGATALCVALAAEGVELRAAGVTAPILVLSEQPLEQIEAMIRFSLTPTLYTPRSVRAWGEALASHPDRVAGTPNAGTVGPVAVHVKIDSGMQRVGAQPTSLEELVEALLAEREHLRVEGVFTHLACADTPDDPANAAQLAEFDAALARLSELGIEPAVVHAANSAAALSVTSARRSLVRLGIAMYGISPGDGVGNAIAALPSRLEPALSLRARVSMVKQVEAGTAVSYGMRRRFERPTTLATVPIGYADGVARRLGTGRELQPGFEVLIHGRRCPIVGVVTMDQLVVDVGTAVVEVGDEVVLIGAQGDDRIAAEDWAEHLDTIGYEVVCGISGRVPRHYSGAQSEPR